MSRGVVLRDAGPEVPKVVSKPMHNRPVGHIVHRVGGYCVTTGRSPVSVRGEGMSGGGFDVCGDLSGKLARRQFRAPVDLTVNIVGDALRRDLFFQGGTDQIGSVMPP